MPRLVADGRDGRVLDGRQRVRGDRQAGDAAGHGPQDLLVVEGHLEALVGVLVVRPVDAVEGLDVGRREPVHRAVEPRHDVVELERRVGDGLLGGRHLLAADLVASAVDGVQEGLGEVDACAEELHLLADAHRRDAARDGRVIPPRIADELVGLVLHRRRVDRHARAVVLEALRELGAPEHGHVRLGCRTQVVERLEVAERVLRHERTTVLAHAGDRLGDPRRVAREERRRTRACGGTGRCAA